MRAARGARGWYSPGREGGGGRAAALWLERGKREQGLFSINAAATGNSSEAAGGQRSRRSQWQPRPALSGARGRGSSRSPGTPRSALHWNRPERGHGRLQAPSQSCPAPIRAWLCPAWAGLAVPEPRRALRAGGLSPSGHHGVEGAARAGASSTEVAATQGGSLSPTGRVWDTPHLGDRGSACSAVPGGPGGTGDRTQALGLGAGQGWGPMGHPGPLICEPAPLPEHSSTPKSPIPPIPPTPSPWGHRAVV